jgi:hypothetical protein
MKRRVSFRLPVSFSKQVSTPPAFTHLISLLIAGNFEKGGCYGLWKLDRLIGDFR